MAATRVSSKTYVNPEVLQAYLTTVQSDVSEIKGTLSKLTEAVTGIERLETRQIAMMSEIEAARVNQSGFERRISAIEQDMPGLRELRRWVVGGMVTGIGMMLIAVASLVFTPRPYVLLPQQSASKITQNFDGEPHQHAIESIPNKPK